MSGSRRPQWRLGRGGAWRCAAGLESVWYCDWLPRDRAAALTIQRVRDRQLGAVDRGLVETCFADARPQIVENCLRRRPAEERERPHIRADPIDKALAKSRFRIGVAGCAEDREEQLTLAHLAGRPVNHLQRRAAVINKRPLASDMQLPHR